MYKISSFLIMFSIILFACKTTIEPIVYDKEHEIIDKENELIHVLIKNENFKEAENHIEKNLKLYPNNSDILHLKGWLLLSKNMIDESEELFLSLLKKNNKNPLVLGALARISRIKGNTSEALEYIKKGLALTPLSILWLEKGIIEYEDQDYKRALADFNKAYNINNKNTDAYFFKYLTMLQLNREIEDIKQYWENILSNKAAKNWYFLHHASILYDLKKRELSIDVLKNGLLSYPNDSYLLNMHAFVLYEDFKTTGNKDFLNKAKTNITKCINLENDLKPEFIDTYLLILETLDEIDVLKKELRKYFLLFPESQLMIDWMKKLEK